MNGSISWAAWLPNEHLNCFMELARILPDKALPVHRSEEDFLTAVVTQLVKDFQWDLERVKKANMPMNSLVEGEIEWGMDHDQSGTFAAFYRLDLGEDLVRTILHDFERPKAISMLAEKCLQRAALKVWTRWTYSVQ